MKQIEHLVILMMENRSFDHFLGALTLNGRTDVDGHSFRPRTNPDVSGKSVPAWQMDGEPFGFPDPPHGWDAAHKDFNGGANDGFVQQYQYAYASANPQVDPRIPMGYYTDTTLPVYYALADRFTVCDHWFGSVLSSTWPNRKYLHSGRRDADNDTQSLPPFPGFGTTPIWSAIEQARDPDTNQPLMWKCYFADLPFLGFWYKFAAFHALDNFGHVGEFVDDCRENRLPTISIIDPAFSLADDHPSHDPRLGQKFVGLIVDALSTSDSWATSALVILYDENGGFYDHVPPPQCFENPPSADSPMGFRVPAIIVSPYAKQRFCSKVHYDHTSVMRSISDRWKVTFGPEYGTRWQSAPSIWGDCFDFNQTPSPGIYTGAPILDVTWGTGVHELLIGHPNPLESLIERIFVLPELKQLDRRADVFDLLRDLEQKVIALKRMV